VVLAQAQENAAAAAPGRIDPFSGPVAAVLGLRPRQGRTADGSGLGQADPVAPLGPEADVFLDPALGGLLRGDAP
jgi:hypothetical protein